LKKTAFSIPYLRGSRLNSRRSASGIEEKMEDKLEKILTGVESISHSIAGSPHKTVQVVKKMLGMLCKPLIHA